MDFLNNSEPIRIKKRDGTPKNPFIHITEEITVYNNMVFLREIPDEYERVIVKKGEQYYNEVTNKNDIDNDLDYYVDYREGIVYFNGTANGKTLTFKYKGTGVILYPASRIYIDSESMTPEQTLRDLVVDVEDKKATAQTQADYAKSQGDYAKTQGDFLS